MAEPDAADLADIDDLLDVYQRFFDGLLGSPDTKQTAAATLTLAFVMARAPSQFPRYERT